MMEETADTVAAASAAALARRDQFMASVPGWYRGQVHFVLIHVIAGLILYAVGRTLHGPSWSELAVAPLAFVFANYVEWRLHKGPLHRPGWPRILYRRHTLLHHAGFWSSCMAIRNPRELRIVLFPLPALLGVALLAAPPALALAALATANAGRVFYLVCIGYYLLYEWCHLAFHLPADSWLGRRALVRWLRINHTRHHAPAVMAHKNFNITFPIWDRILGTFEHGDHGDHGDQSGRGTRHDPG